MKNIYKVQGSINGEVIQGNCYLLYTIDYPIVVGNLNHAHNISAILLFEHHNNFLPVWAIYSDQNIRRLTQDLNAGDSTLANCDWAYYVNTSVDYFIENLVIENITKEQDYDISQEVDNTITFI